MSWRPRVFSRLHGPGAVCWALALAGCLVVAVAGVLGTAPGPAGRPARVPEHPTCRQLVAAPSLTPGPAHRAGGPGLDSALAALARLDAGSCRRTPGAPGAARRLAHQLEVPAARAHPVEVSPACRRRTGDAARAAVGLSGRRAPAVEVLAAADRLAGLLGEGCTVGDQRALSLAVLVPARASATGGAAPFAARVAAPGVRAQLSASCAQALGPVRATLTAKVGRSMSTREIDALQRAVAGAAPSCAAGELEAFERTEVAPALGLQPLGAPGG